MGKSRILFGFLILVVMMVVSCTSVTKTLRLTPRTLDFEEVYLGNVSDLQVTLKNKFGKDVYISKIELTGSLEYSFVGGPYSPITLIANEEMIIEIRYEPQSPGGVADAMLIIEHDASNKNKELSITGIGVPAARMEISDKTIDFWKVYLGRSRTYDVEIKNVGTDNMLVNSITFSGANPNCYKISAGTIPFTLIPNDKSTFTVEFTPPSAGSFPASMIIDHNAVNEDQLLSIALIGEGSATDPEISFSEISPWYTGKTRTTIPSTHELTLTSSGLDPLTVSEVKFVTGTNYTLMDIKDKNGSVVSLPKMLQPGDTLTVKFEFAPTAQKLYEDMLSVEHDGVNEVPPYLFKIESDGKVPIEKTFIMTGQIENWTVPANVTELTIEVWGAQGARSGGKGAYMKGDFTVNPGDTFKILVGQIGFDGDNTRTYLGGGGGGGSFVCKPNNDPVIIAGGGGGKTSIGTYSTIDGRSTTDGGDTLSNGGGNNGYGGEDGLSNAPAAGGGGLLTKGGDANTRSCVGGEAFINGGTGGIGTGTGTGGGNGGFGGGGGGYTNAFNRGGGGGGYSGGQGGTWDGQYSGGGGGSINNGTNQVNTDGVNTGEGKIVITYID